MRTYISLFSSAGVGCFGFKSSFQCVATNELIEERLDIQRANNKCKYASGYICGDITSPIVQQKLFDEISFWKDSEGLKQIDVLFATPPCQGMSTANYKKNEHEQNRNSLVVEAIKIIQQIQPKIFILENVRAFMKTICTDISGDDMSIKDSIFNNLSCNYHISWKIINFKDYGVPSSRPRTIVIGTHKSLKNLSPLNLFPTRCPEITLRSAIGDLTSLPYGAKDSTDFLHFARRFPEYQLDWIKNLKEGESAFQNPIHAQPYKINTAGERVKLKGAYMGNKYRRLLWDKPCSCIATRNDQLASQDTIHPSDNRVLSIRELMRLMTIPDSFKWTNNDDVTTPKTSDKYLKDNELNIRRCIGEAVPTHIITDIADKIQTMLDFEDFVNNYDSTCIDRYLSNKTLIKNFYIYTFLEEQKIDHTKQSGVFYTPQCVVYDALKNVNISNNIIHILEPAVGLGAFIPQLSSLFSDAESIHIDVVEINPDTIKQLKKSLKKIRLGSNIHINYICGDFLKLKLTKHYDLVATNPPYALGKLSYPEILQNTHKTKNLFALFLIKLHSISEDIVCVIPKNFIMADEFSTIRDLYRNYPIVHICDYGVKFFKKVFVEIIAIHFSKNFKGRIVVTDYVNQCIYTHKQGYIYHDKVWLIYRDAFFDKYIKKMRLNVFSAFRDRQITNGKLKNSGKIWVLRSKNILDNGNIVHIKGYDKYVDNPTDFTVNKYMNSKAILMPNFTYNTRAAILPDNTIPNGSIAILIPRKEIDKPDLSLYATAEFRQYYAIVKSKSRFTLNIDKSSLYYIGILK